MTKPKLLVVMGSSARPAEAASLDEWQNFEITLAVSPQRADWLNQELGAYLRRIKIKPLPIKRAIPIPGAKNQPLRDGATLKGLEDEVKKTDFVQIYTLGSYLGYHASRLAKRYHKPLITEVWETFIFPWLACPPYCWWAREVMNNTTLFLARTKRSKRLLQQLGVPAHKILIAYASPASRLFFPAHKTQEANTNNVILFSGQLVKSKGILNLIEAFEALQNEHPQAKLIISGFGKEEHLVQEKVISNEQIEFIGNIPYTAMGDVYRSGTVFCSPDQPWKIGPIKMWEEMVPWTFREAAACGLPIITGSWLVEEGLQSAALAGGANLTNKKESADRLAKTLSYLLGQARLRQELGGKALIWARENLNPTKEEETLQLNLSKI